MAKFARVAPPNSLLFISDSSDGLGPEFIPGQLILSSPSCISVGCFMWQDGQTDVTLGDAHEVDPGGSAAFDGLLDTSSRAVVVWTVERETIFDTPVPNSRTRVRIWVNRPVEPDKVIIGLG
jgi:hypothetical protein